LDTKVLLFPKDILTLVNAHYSSLQKLDNIMPIVRDMYKKRYKPNCFFDNKHIDKKCFNKADYFYKYVFYLGLQNKLPSEEEILGFGNYKVFNKVAIGYYHLGDFEKAKLYLFKAYALAPNRDRRIIAHNLATLYFLDDAYAKETPKKVVKYLTESSFAIDKFNLGVCYYMGYGVKESDSIARKYFQSAANNGIKKAIKNIQIMNKFKIGLKN